MNFCQRNVARFVYMECRFEKIKDIFQGFGSLVSLPLQKDGGAKSKQPIDPQSLLHFLDIFSPYMGQKGHFRVLMPIIKCETIHIK